VFQSNQRVSMKQTTDIAIIGGGIIGCAIAYNLRKAGAEVTLLERGEIGREASSAAAGLLAPLGPLPGPGPLADLLLASFAMFPTLVPELEEASGLDLGYERTGSLRTVRNPKRVPNLQKRLDAWKPLGLEMHWLSGDEARKLEPLLSPDISAAIYVPEESHIQASTLVNAFARAASNAGATIRNHTDVIGLQRDCHRITGVRTEQDEIITCNHLILATGAWAGCYDEWLDMTLPVEPLRGQILAYQQPITSIRHIIFGEAAYLAPKGNSVIVGATKEEVGFDTSITVQGQSWLIETATRLVPSLNQSSIERAWAGLRPKTPDGWPILGPAPRWENVTLATGHNSIGTILSAITGQMIAECVIRKYVPDIIRPFSVTRFEHKL
jgi:glycine oxidase